MKKHFIWALCLVGAILGTMSSCEPSGPEEGAEIYAAISADGNILTLYFDAQREKRGGERGWRNVYNNNASTPNYQSNHVKQIVLDKSMTFAKPTTTANWFDGFEHAETIEHLDYLDVTEVHDFSCMFRGCHALKAIDVSHFNPRSAGDCSSMFQGCDAVTSLDLRNMGYFSGNLMFHGCSKLKTIYCDMDFSAQDSKYRQDMFLDCTSLVGGKGTKYDANHTGVEYARPDGANGEKGYFTGCATELYAAFDAGSSTLTLYHDNLKETRSQVMYLDKMTLPQRHAVKTVEIDPSLNDHKPPSTERWFANMSSLENVKNLAYLTSWLKDVSYMFMNCTSLKTIDLTGFRFPNAKKDAMFIGCSALTTIICSDDYSSSTQSSSQMFNGCTSLVGGRGTKYSDANMDASYARLDDPNNGKPGYFTRSGIFAMMSDDETTLTLYYQKNPNDLPGKRTKWDENLGNEGLGEYCKNVKKIVLDESVKEALPTLTKQWFSEFYNLETIEHLDYLNTSKVENMNRMFAESGIKVIDLTGFDMHKVMWYEKMFENCKVETIYCNDDWSKNTPGHVVFGTSTIFLNATHLVGGKGTKYDANNTGIEYARPDGLDGKPGYFTRK